MPVDFTKVKGSQSTDGKMIGVAATATPGTALHTAVAGQSSWDEVWIYAVNIDTSIRRVTIEWGGTSGADQIVMELPVYGGLMLVVPGLILDNGLSVAAFADAANKVNIALFINRISVL